MTVVMKIDLVGPKQRGLAMGLTNSLLISPLQLQLQRTRAEASRKRTAFGPGRSCSGS